MYLKHFNLTERPFSITPDPRFLYMSVRHKEALAHLLYGLGEGDGFVQLTGEVGTGKTTICRCVLEQVPENVDIAMVLNPKVTAIELIATVCDELGIKYSPESSIKALIDVLNEYLLEAYTRGRRTVLIIDEAQNLDTDVLEQVRLLTNLETSSQKLLQIVLIGQPELRDLLASEAMRQLSQRITARYHLEPITREEAEAYIKHRLQICGSSRNIFSARAINRIHKLSGGIPRLINVLCDRSLLGAYVDGKTQVDMKVLKKAATEALNETRPGQNNNYAPWLLGVLAVAAVVALFIFLPLKNSVPPVAEPVAQAGEGMAVTTDGSLDTRVVESAPVSEAESMLMEESVQASGSASGAMPQLQGDSTDVASSPADDNQAKALATLLMLADGGYEKSAWRELFALWSVVLPADADADFCGFAKQYGLLCMQERGNWNTLRHLDRPVILKLVATDGRRIPAVLQYLDNRSAELIVGEELYRLNVGQLDQFWYGDYTLLLQTPPGRALFLRQGSQSKDVAWLRTQLETAQGVEIASSNPLFFDKALKQHLIDFQGSHGLVTDGVMGKNTIIHLNSQSSPADIPRLSVGQP